MLKLSMSIYFLIINWGKCGVLYIMLKVDFNWFI